MPHDPAAILEIFDACAKAYTFPMLDNGYIYPAATRLSLFRSPQDWALVLEHFGYSPRAGLPDVTISTFASTLRDRDTAGSYATPEAYQLYLRGHPHDEMRSAYPLEEGPWMDEEVFEHVALAGSFRLRGRDLALPPLTAYRATGVELEGEQVAIFEFSRWLAATHREEVLATPEERRMSVPAELTQLLVLDDWHHPNLIEGELPSETASFRQFAEVLSTGDVARYRPTETPNVHWSNWPEGGTL